MVDRPGQAIRTDCSLLLVKRGKRVGIDYLQSENEEEEDELPMRRRRRRKRGRSCRKTPKKSINISKRGIILLKYNYYAKSFEWFPMHCG